MSILKRARDRLPQEYLANGGIVRPSYRQDGGILPRYDRTPTQHPTGYSYDTIKYRQHPWDLGNFVTSPGGTPAPYTPYTPPPPVSAPVVDAPVSDSDDQYEVEFVTGPPVDTVTTDAAGNEAPYLGVDEYDLEGDDNFLTEEETAGNVAIVDDFLSGVDLDEELSADLVDGYDPYNDILGDDPAVVEALLNEGVGDVLDGDPETDETADRADIALDNIYNNVQQIYGEATGNEVTSLVTGDTSQTALDLGLPADATAEEIIAEEERQTAEKIAQGWTFNVETGQLEPPAGHDLTPEEKLAAGWTFNVQTGGLDPPVEEEEIILGDTGGYDEAPVIAEETIVEDPITDTGGYDEAPVITEAPVVETESETPSGILGNTGGYDEAPVTTTPGGILDNTGGYDEAPVITPPTQEETTSETAANQGSEEAIVTDATSDLITQREGYSSTAYPDPPGSGKFSIGHGTQTYADGTPVKEGDIITEEEAAELRDHHIGVAAEAALNNIDNFNELSPELQSALTSHAYQLGEAGQAEFEKMIAAIEAGDWETAIAEAEDSLWAQQTPKRLADLKAALEAEKLANTPALEWSTRTDGLESAYGPDGWVYRFEGQEYGNINDAYAAKKYSQLTAEEQADVEKYSIPITATTNLTNVRNNIADLKAEEEVFSQPVEVATPAEGILANTGGYDEAPVTTTPEGILADTGGYDEAPVVIPEPTPEWETAGYSSENKYNNRVDTAEWSDYGNDSGVNQRAGWDQEGNYVYQYQYGDQVFDNNVDAVNAEYKDIASQNPNDVLRAEGWEGEDGELDYWYNNQLYDNRSDAQTAEKIAEDNIRDQEWSPYFSGSSVNSRTGYNDAGKRVTIYETGGEEYDNYSDAKDAATDIQNVKDIQANVGSGEVDAIGDSYYYDGKSYDSWTDAWTAEDIAEENIRDQPFVESHHAGILSKSGYNDVGEHTDIYQVGGEEYDNLSDAKDARDDIQNVKDIQANVDSGEIDTIAGNYYYEGQQYGNYAGAYAAKRLAEAVTTDLTYLGDSDGDGEYEYAYGGESYDSYSDAKTAERIAEENIRDAEFTESNSKGISTKGGYNDAGKYVAIYQVGGEEYTDRQEAEDAALDINTVKKIQANKGSGEITYINGEIYYDGKKYDNLQDAWTAEDIAEDHISNATWSVNYYGEQYLVGYDDNGERRYLLRDGDRIYDQDSGKTVGYETESGEIIIIPADVVDKIPEGRNTSRTSEATIQAIIDNPSDPVVIVNNQLVSVGYDEGQVDPALAKAAQMKEQQAAQHSSSNDDGPSDHSIHVAAQSAISQGQAPVGSAGGPSPHNNMGGIIRRQGGGIINYQQPQQSQSPYRGILMNKLNRRKR